MCVHLSLTTFLFCFVFVFCLLFVCLFLYCVSLVFGDPLDSDLVRSMGIRQGPRCLLLILFLLFSLILSVQLYFVI